VRHALFLKDGSNLLWNEGTAVDELVAQQVAARLGAGHDGLDLQAATDINGTRTSSPALAAASGARAVRVRNRAERQYQSVEPETACARTLEQRWESRCSRNANSVKSTTVFLAATPAS